MSRTKLIVAVLLTAFISGGAQGALITTAAVADAEIGERTGAASATTDTGNGTGTALNYRTTAPQATVANDRNEFIALKFDLTGINVASATSVSLKLVHNRANTSVRPYIVYGVNDGALGADNNTAFTPARGYDDNTWDETLAKFSNFPGLLYDSVGNSTSQGIVAADVTNVGSGNLSSAAEGAIETFNTSGLLAFLQAHPDNLVTLLISKNISLTPSTGQDRFASKEATALATGGGPVAAGTYAPSLEFEVEQVPEPAGFVLAAIVLGLSGIARGRRR